MPHVRTRYEIDPNDYIPTAMLMLPEPSLRDLMRRFGHQFRNDRYTLNEVTRKDCELLCMNWPHSNNTTFKKGELSFSFQYLAARPFLDKGQRQFFYVLGTPLEVSKRLDVNVVVSERLKEETVIFIFHVQYAL